MTDVADQSTHAADHAAKQPQDQAAGLPEQSESPAARPGRRRLVIAMSVIPVLVLALDAITKQLVLSNLTTGEPRTLIPGVLYMDLIRNSGAAFSFGTNHTWIFPVITIVVIGVIVWTAPRVRSLGWAIAFGLILGGAFGNLADRLFRAPGVMRGEVVDFLSLFSKDGGGFAIFNVADSALSCGVVLLVALELLGRRMDGTRHAPAWRRQPEVRD